MRSLIVHADNFEAKINAKSNRPYGIVPETQRAEVDRFQDGLVVFFCVEEGDNEIQLEKLYNEITKAANEIQTNKVLIAPFVHLSQNIADPQTAKEFYKTLLNKVKDANYQTSSSHFGYHKTLSLDIKGHPGSFRFREF
jgi:threonyl-tRNA synthetase